MTANLSAINILPKRVADVYIKMKSITSKLYNTSASIAFVTKALFVDMITKFAIVKGKFINEMDSIRKLMKSHLTKHVQDLEMVSHGAINDIMQTPKKEVHISFFSVCCIVFNCS